MDSTGESSGSSLDDWVVENGGDVELVDLLKANGFMSKLSLKNIDFGSPEASSFVDQLSYGQKCLLKGLVDVLSTQGPKSLSPDPYTSGASKAATLTNKSISLRDKIGKLFHLQTQAKKEEGSDFQPVPPYTKSKPGTKRKGGSLHGKGPLKKKVKEVKLTVVGLRFMCKHTPTGASRVKMTRHIWLNASASEDDVREKVADAFGWSDRKIKFLYAQGKNLREASLSDVENSDSWDFETIRALMGSGSLYVVRHESEESDLSSEEEIHVKKKAAPESDDVVRLKDMFPDVPPARIKDLLNKSSVSEVVDMLVEQNGDEGLKHVISTSTSSDEDLPIIDLTGSTMKNSSAGCPGPSHSSDDVREYSSVQDVINHHSSKMVHQFSEYSLTVDRSSRDNFWMAVLSFYKGALRKPEKLKKCLTVTFVNSGEQGSDAGALKKEFFENSLREVNYRLLEGEDTRRIPKKDVSLELMFEVAGMIFAHSIVQEGPAMPCMSPAIFDYLTHGDISRCYPVKEDIPLNLSTHHLITAIEELDKADTEDSIYAAVDKPTTMMIINSSRWSVIESITKNNKDALLQQLILEEVVIRRETNILAFQRGMYMLGVSELIQCYPTLMRPLLVAEEKVLTSEQFMSFIGSLKPSEPAELLAYNRFVELITYIGGEHDLGKHVSLASLLRFITGTSTVSPMGLTIPIEISYYSQSSGNTLPGAAVCSHRVFLPICHSNKREFFADVRKALEFGSGFGRP